MTLQQYINQGNPMLSNYTSRWCCRERQIREKDLRAMELEEIYQIPMAGEVAKREVLRWKQFKTISDLIQNRL